MHIGNKFLAVAAMTVVMGVSSAAIAQDHNHSLFANQYTQGYANQATAQMYVAPVPVPSWVGHTYYTYQPLYPHEMMTWHNHRYHNYYDGGRGLNRTGVHYYAPPVRTVMSGLVKSFSIARP